MVGVSLQWFIMLILSVDIEYGMQVSWMLYTVSRHSVQPAGILVAVYCQQTQCMGCRYPGCCILSVDIESIACRYPGCCILSVDKSMGCRYPGCCILSVDKSMGCRYPGCCILSVDIVYSLQVSWLLYTVSRHREYGMQVSWLLYMVFLMSLCRCARPVGRATRSLQWPELPMNAGRTNQGMCVYKSDNVEIMFCFYLNIAYVKTNL